MNKEGFSLIGIIDEPGVTSSDHDFFSIHDDFFTGYSPQTIVWVSH